MVEHARAGRGHRVDREARRRSCRLAARRQGDRAREAADRADRDRVVGLVAGADLDRRWRRTEGEVGRAYPGHEGVVAAVVGEVRADGHREGRLGRVGEPGQGGREGTVDRDATPGVVPGTADVAAVVEARAVGGDLGDEGVSVVDAAAVVAEVRAEQHRKARLVRLGITRDVGTAGIVDGDAVGGVVH